MQSCGTSSRQNPRGNCAGYWLLWRQVPFRFRVLLSIAFPFIRCAFPQIVAKLAIDVLEMLVCYSRVWAGGVFPEALCTKPFVAQFLFPWVGGGKPPIP